MYVRPCPVTGTRPPLILRFMDFRTSQVRADSRGRFYDRFVIKSIGTRSTRNASITRESGYRTRCLSSRRSLSDDFHSSDATARSESPGRGEIFLHDYRLPRAPTIDRFSFSKKPAILSGPYTRREGKKSNEKGAEQSNPMAELVQNRFYPPIVDATITTTLRFFPWIGYFRFHGISQIALTRNERGMRLPSFVRPTENAISRTGRTRRFRKDDSLISANCLARFSYLLLHLLPCVNPFSPGRNCTSRKRLPKRTIFTSLFRLRQLLS